MGQTHIPSDTLEALHQLHQKGIYVFICTGRAPSFQHEGTKAFDFDGFITSNGQYIYLKDGTLIHEHYLPKASLEILFPYVKEHHIALSVASLEAPFRNNDRFDPHLPIDDPNNHLSDSILQLMAFIPPKDDDAFLAHLPGAKSARWTEYFADIIPADGGKEVGIEKMNAHFGWTMDEVMCFGDGGNDISMLQAVPCSVAMGNASDDVKKEAHYVTTNCNEGGIFNALNHFGVI